MSSTEYREFLDRKMIRCPATGLAEVPPLPAALFPFQRDICTWALRRGRAAVFAGTGLGKSLIELAWGRAVHESTGHNVLLLTPLAVAPQMVREAHKFGLAARQCRDQDDVQPGVTVTNYEKLPHFQPSDFGAIILDESSILKSLDGKTRGKLLETFRRTPFRLAATATPAPNDFMELGNHAEFLGAVSYSEMLSMFFVHDGGETQKWRLKRHAQTDFWRWMCSWAVMLRHPEDLGYVDDRYHLPPLRYHQHLVGADYASAAALGQLFPMEAQTLQERLAAKRITVKGRVKLAAELTPTDRPFVWWCHLNRESEALTAAIPGAVEVRGSDSEADKERKLDDFALGKVRVLITKPTICGHGLNWQHCADTGFVGLNDSFEQVYQAVRRFWRFGQTRPVNVHLIASELEGAVTANLRRKEAQADTMAAEMVSHMADLNAIDLKGISRTHDEYRAVFDIETPTWLEAECR